MEKLNLGPVGGEADDECHRGIVPAGRLIQHLAMVVEGDNFQKFLPRCLVGGAWRNQRRHARLIVVARRFAGPKYRLVDGVLRHQFESLAPETSRSRCRCLTRPSQATLRFS